MAKFKVGFLFNKKVTLHFMALCVVSTAKLSGDKLLKVTLKIRNLCKGQSLGFMFLSTAMEL